MKTITAWIDRPLVGLDLETTSVNKQDCRITQIGMLKLYPDGQFDKFKTYVNPTVPISPGATKVTGITNEMVADAPKFFEIAPQVYEFLQGCDLMGYNSNDFDVPVLWREFTTANIDWDIHEHRQIDAGSIFKIQESRTLSAALKFFCDEEMVDAHDAMNDVEATFKIFMGQLERYPDLPRDMAALEKFCNYDRGKLDPEQKFAYNADGDIVLNFGNERKGEKAIDHISFLNWMLSKNFSKPVKEICRQIIEQYQEGFYNQTPPDELPF